jgi:hypothetical protein
MSKMPYMRFFVDNWRSHMPLRMCSAAARGLWIDMLCIMHEAEPRGHLLIKGRAPTIPQLAKLFAMSEEECSAFLDELRENEVFSVKRNGIIFSRKMERDEIKASKNRDNGAKGGNPKLRYSDPEFELVDPTTDGNKTEIRESVNPKVIPPVNRSFNPPDNPQVKAHGVSHSHSQKEEQILRAPDPTTHARETARDKISDQANGQAGNVMPFDPPAPADDDGFSLFWAIYPRPENRVKAEAEWITQRLFTPAETIVAGARAFADAHKASGQERRFEPLPANWLKDQRWTDVIPPPDANKAMTDEQLEIAKLNEIRDRYRRGEV